MKAVRIAGPQKLETIDIPEPHAGPEQVVIRVRNVGICGSDLHIYVGRHPNVKLPIIPGHEFAGDVIEAGAGATHKVGERVVVEPLVTCDHCYYCKRGQYNLCTSLKFLGNQVDGAKAAGVAYVAVVEPVEWRQKLAQQIGADLVVKPEDANQILNDTEVGADVSIEAVGKSETAALALSLTKKGGRTVIAGVFEIPQLQLKPMEIVDNEKEIVGTVGYSWGDFPTAISLISKGQVDAKKLVSRVLTLDKAKEGFELGLSRNEVVKVQLQP